MMNVRAREDAEILYKSISTTYFGTDQKALLNLVGRRSNQHMQLVRDEFEKLYGKDLVKEIENNVSFKFKKLLVGLIKSYPEYRGEEVYDSLKGLITDKWALVDFIIGNDPRSVEEFKQFFRQKYGTSLSDLIAQEVSGDFREVLLLALEARRGVGVEEDLVGATCWTCSGSPRAT
uniref:Annexin n=1 Tax=Hordeum vulgare subsp. vulgare TaxID=112509 RepID=F2DYI8_HORVV|nr:predicted protein [Hordeum vulgare subsp. vulgare]